MTAKRTSTIAITIAAFCAMCHLAPAVADDKEEGFKPIFDGKTLDGWEGNLKFFKVRDREIVCGSLKRPMEQSEYLCTKKEYENFELRLKAKVVGLRNTGVQIRTSRVPNSTSRVVGYQVDMGFGYSPKRFMWGAIFDEGRRGRPLIEGDQEKLKKVVKPGEFNDLVIRCEGPRIQIWVNGEYITDYREPDKKIARKGVIGFQCHRGEPQEASFKALRIKEL